MQKPTPEEVSRYAYKKGFILNGEEFCDFYESKGWMVGKSPMKVWEAAVMTWKHKAARDGRLRVPKPEQTISEQEKMTSAKDKLEMRMQIEWSKREAMKQAAIRDQMKSEKMEESYGGWSDK